MSAHAGPDAAVAAVTCALVHDDRQLGPVLDDSDTHDLARVLAKWCAELLTHDAVHGCHASPADQLREAGVRFAAEAAA